MSADACLMLDELFNYTRGDKSIVHSQTALSKVEKLWRHKQRNLQKLLSLTLNRKEHVEQASAALISRLLYLI